MPFPCGEVWGASTYSGHNAIDWNLIGANDSGRRVEAGLAGTVTTASGNGQWNGGYGNYVIVAHGDGWASLYAHLSAVSVSVGQGVAANTMIGAVGTTGNSTGSHLHWEQRLNGIKQYPLYENGSVINPASSPDGNPHTSHNCGSPASLADGDLYRIGSAPEVYVVIGGAKFHITNPDELQRRLNNGDGPVLSVTQAQHDALGTVPRDGTLFRNEDSLQQYLVVAPAAMPVNSGDVGPLRSEGVDTDNVQVAPPGLSTALGSVPRAGVVIRGAGGVELWHVDTAGHRRQIPRAAPNDRVLACRLGPQQVLLAPGGALNALPEGPWADCTNHMIEDQATGAVSYLDGSENRWPVGNPAIRDCLAGRRGTTGPVTVSATIISSFPASGRNAYCPYPVGSLVRGAGQSEVWQIRPNGKRVYVPDDQTIACLGGSVSVVPTGEVDGHTHIGTATCPRPDARIRRASGTYVGNNIYNTNGSGQTRTGSAARGGTVTYFVAVQNDARFPEELRLRGTASTTRYAIRYTAGGDDITSQVAAGTYTTPTLAPGATQTIKVVVTVRNAAPSGSSLAATLITKSNTDPARRDTVRFVTSRRGLPRVEVTRVVRRRLPSVGS